MVYLLNASFRLSFKVLFTDFILSFYGSFKNCANHGTSNAVNALGQQFYLIFLIPYMKTLLTYHYIQTIM